MLSAYIKVPPSKVHPVSQEIFSLILTTVTTSLRYYDVWGVIARVYVWSMCGAAGARESAMHASLHARPKAEIFF